MSQFPCIGIIGPRQVGKTTLAKMLVEGRNNALYLDLESDLDIAKLTDPGLFLRRNADKLIILDEIQLMPALFPLLRAIIDEDRRPGRFILLGSASPHLIRSSAESLAGRIAYLELTSFMLSELDKDSMEKLWLQGGFPEAFFLEKNESLDWRKQFLQTYILRDLPLLGLETDWRTLSTFLKMAAGQIGQIWNANTYAKSLGISGPTVKKYLDFLEGAFLLDVLPPYFRNIKKRLVKSPKLYYKDIGLAHSQLNIIDIDGMMANVLLGHSWENFVIQQVKNTLGDKYGYYFYRTHEGTEADLVLTLNEQPHITIEIKYSNAPQLSKGFIIATEDLSTRFNFIITPSSDRFPVRENIDVINLWDFLQLEI